MIESMDGRMDGWTVVLGGHVGPNASRTDSLSDATCHSLTTAAAGAAVSSSVPPWSVTERGGQGGSQRKVTRWQQGSGANLGLGSGAPRLKYGYSK